MANHKNKTGNEMHIWQPRPKSGKKKNKITRTEPNFDALRSNEIGNGMGIRQLPGGVGEKEECKHAHIKSGHLLKIRVIIIISGELRTDGNLVSKTTVVG
jgi:hypothetical protein